MEKRGLIVMSRYDGEELERDIRLTVEGGPPSEPKEQAFTRLTRYYEAELEEAS